MNSLPQHPTLGIDRLAGVFRATSSTYKFYWLLALLELVGEGRTKIPLRTLYVRMVCNAWYTVNYFKLSFGAWDSLPRFVKVLLEHEAVDARTARNDLELVLLHTERQESLRALLGLGRYVPYKFLSPWLTSAASDALVMRRSQDPAHGTPYALYADHLVVPEQWALYFKQHHFILRDFCLWNLAHFVQAKNPNVPQVVNKLVKPPSRAALTRQRDLWNAVLDHTGGLSCIYTGMHLTSGEHHIEHFIPHAFVAHDQLWNLVPASPEFNLHKSDRLPHLSTHLSPFVDAHWQLLNVVRDEHISSRLLEDYDIAFHLPHLDIRDKYLFGDKLRDTIVPLHGSAMNNGFSEVA